MFSNQNLVQEQEKLHRFAYKLTQNTHDAEDLLQATLLRAIEKKHLFNEGTNLFSWTSKMMYNLFVSGYRRKVKYETQYDPESFIEREQVESSQEVKSELNTVSEAIDRLSEDHRNILMMICVNGYAYEDVSKKLRIPLGTVRSRLSRARAGLKDILNKPRIQTSRVPMAA